MAIYDHVTAEIIAQLDKGVVPWIRPWAEDSKALSPWGLPFNIAKGREYRGANVPLLWSIRQRNQWESDAWLTLKQANELGGQVNKGERASWVHFYHWREDGEGKRFPTLRAYRVFNIAQTTGCELPSRTGFQELGTGALEDRVRALGARVRLGGNRAYFSVQEDRIALPLPDQFRDRANFYSTLAHEMTHWTGHASRLNRDLANHFGTAGYAREELVAELGSAFVCAKFGIPLEGLQHPEYLGSWLKVLKEDSRAIMRAASAAQRAADLIVGTTFDQPEEEEAKEEAAPTVVAVPAIPDPVPTVDDDTKALAAQYVGEIARALYWAGHANMLDRELEAKAEAIKAKASKPKVHKSGPNKGLPQGWQRHPVTGWPMRVPCDSVGQDIRDLIPYGRDAAMLKRVAKHYATHARIGAANVLTYCEEQGVNPAQYRIGLMSRRKEAGPHSYNYGPRAIDPAVVLEIDHGRTRSVQAGEQVHA